MRMGIGLEESVEILRVEFGEDGVVNLEIIGMDHGSIESNFS